MVHRNKTRNRNRNKTRNSNRNKTKDKKGRGPESLRENSRIIFSNLISMFKKCLRINNVDELNKELTSIQVKIEELTQQKVQFQNEFSKINDKIEELIADKENNEDAETDIDNARTELDNKRSELKNIIKKIRRLSGSRSITSKLSKTRAITLR